MEEKKTIQFGKMPAAAIVLMLFALLVAAVPVIAEDTNNSNYKNKLKAIS